MTPYPRRVKRWVKLIGTDHPRPRTVRHRLVVRWLRRLDVRYRAWEARLTDAGGT